MMKRRYGYAIFAFLGMLVLILDAKTALSGAGAAVQLCLTSVIPSLFPFFVLSNLLTGGLSGSSIPIFRPMGRLLGIPQGCESIFVTGLLGGYPSGAQAVHQAWKDGCMSRHDAQRMLSFCSNAGPAFLFGILGQKFPALWMIWLLWGIHILSAMLVAGLQPHVPGDGAISGNTKAVSLTVALKQSVTVCGWVCGWIMVFRVMMAFLSRWFLWLLPQEGQVAVYGLLELAGGCCALDDVPNLGLRFILASGMLGFGGICVAMQTASVTSGLHMGSYWLGKVTQCAISVFLASIAQMFLFPAQQRVRIPAVIAIGMSVLVIFLGSLTRKRKNNSSIPAVIGV